MKKAILSSLLLICSGFYAEAQIVNVSTATELQNALNAATPGQTIVLAPGTYSRSGGFFVGPGIHGTAQNPTTVQGNGATITSNNIGNGYGFALQGNNYWILSDFKIWKSMKALVIDNSNHNVLSNINVSYIGQEGIHVRKFSSYNLVENCYVDSVGITSAAQGTAEAIYLGSSKNNWLSITGNANTPDTCNYNTVTGCSFGDNVPSENIDIKEGTTGGIITNNAFNGKGLNGINSGDSWVDVKGNNYKVDCNSGANTYNSTGDGIQTHILYTGFGNYNSFANNTFTLGSAGLGINVQTSGSQGSALNNIVCNTNSVTGGTGVSNANTQSCSASCISTSMKNADTKKSIDVYPNPASQSIQINTNSAFTNYYIVDILGKVVTKGSVNKNNNIDISALENGLYFITESSTGLSTKFIKQ